jgi:acetylglutamate kinase
VIACLGADADGGVYNINADMVGNQLAAALKADRLFLITSTPGVLRDVNDPSRASAAHVRRSARSNQSRRDHRWHDREGSKKRWRSSIKVSARFTSSASSRPGDLVRAVREHGAVGTTLRP